MVTPAVAAASSLDIIHAYRRILRGALQAVQYSTPARYIVRDQVRAAFREAPPQPASPPAQDGSSSDTLGSSSGRQGSASAASFDAGVAKRTAWFLEAAARDRGVEHRVVKNLVKVRMERERALRRWRIILSEDKHRKLRQKKQGVFEHYEMTVAMLNKSLGIALR